MTECRDTIPKSGKDGEKFIKDVKERLNWYNFQATEEEYNVKEVEALVNLLGVLEPLDTENTVDTQTAYEQFCRYRAEKAEDAERRAALHKKMTDKKMTDTEIACMEMPGKVSEIREEHSKIRTFMVGSKGAVRAAAVILVMLIAAGGTMRAVNAEKGQGFFYWLEKDASGEKVLLSPQEVDEDTNMRIYYNIEDIPEKYQEYIIDAQKIESLKDYDLQEIEIDNFPLYAKMMFLFVNDEDKLELVLGKIIYQNQMMIQSEKYIDYYYLYSKEEQGVTMDIFMRQDKAEQKDYAVCFYSGNVQYFVTSKLLSEEMEQIAVEYFKSISTVQ